MIRSVSAVVAAVLAGGFMVGIVESVGTVLAPLPAGVDPMNAAPHEIPMINFLFVLLAWAWGAVTAGAIAAMIADRRLILHAMIASNVLLIGGIISLLMIPSPLWFWIIGIVVFPLGGWSGGSVVMRMRVAKGEPQHDQPGEDDADSWPESTLND